MIFTQYKEPLKNPNVLFLVVIAIIHLVLFDNVRRINFVKETDSWLKKQGEHAFITAFMLR